MSQRLTTATESYSQLFTAAVNPAGMDLLADLEDLSQDLPAAPAPAPEAAAKAGGVPGIQARTASASLTLPRPCHVAANWRSPPSSGANAVPDKQHSWLGQRQVIFQLLLQKPGGIIQETMIGRQADEKM
jgi:hypothetical protein